MQFKVGTTNCCENASSALVIDWHTELGCDEKVMWILSIGRPAGETCPAVCFVEAGSRSENSYYRLNLKWA